MTADQHIPGEGAAAEMSPVMARITIGSTTFEVSVGSESEARAWLHRMARRHQPIRPKEERHNGGA